MCASCARSQGIDCRLTVSRRSNTYECRMRLLIKSRISSRASRLRGAGEVVCKEAIVEDEATEDTARGAGVVGGEGEVDEKKAQAVTNCKDKTLTRQRPASGRGWKRRVCSREIGQKRLWMGYVTTTSVGHTTAADETAGSSDRVSEPIGWPRLDISEAGVLLDILHV